MLQQIAKQVSVLTDGIGTALLKSKQQNELLEEKINDLQAKQRASQNSITSVQNSMETVKRLMDNLSKANKSTPTPAPSVETAPAPIDVEAITEQITKATTASIEPLMTALMEKSTPNAVEAPTEAQEAAIHDLFEQYQSLSKQLSDNAQEIRQLLQDIGQNNTDIVNSSMESFRSQALETLSQMDQAKDTCLQDFETKYQELSDHMAAAEEKQVKKHTDALKDMQVAALRNISRNSPGLLTGITIAVIVATSYGMGWYWNNNSKAASYAGAMYYNQAFAPSTGKVAAPEDMPAAEEWMKQYRAAHAEDQHGKDFWTYKK